MNEYLVTVKDYEGEVLEIKAFAINLWK